MLLFDLPQKADVLIHSNTHDFIETEKKSEPFASAGETINQQTYSTIEDNVMAKLKVYKTKNLKTLH